MSLFLLRFLGDWRLWLVVCVLTLLTATHWKAYHSGSQSTQRKWDAAKVEAQAAQQAADESQRLREHAAALSYEQTKAAQQVRYVTVTKEVSHAIETEPVWSGVALPPSMRGALAAAGQAFAASEPGATVRLPAAGDPDQRPVGGGLRVGPGRAGGLLGAPSGAR